MADLITLTIAEWSGQLGNNVMQLVQATFVAEALLSSSTCQAVIQLPTAPTVQRFLDVPPRFTVEWPPCDGGLPETAYVGTGYSCAVLERVRWKHAYFALPDRDGGPISVADRAPSYRRILHTYIRPRFFPVHLRTVPRHPGDGKREIVLHIRSGDCFVRQDGRPVHPAYIPAPLSMLQAVVDTAKPRPYSHVTIITEDDDYNPTVPALVQYVEQSGRPVQVVRGKNDYAGTVEAAEHLLRARHAFAGISFFPSFFLTLAPALETLHSFRSSHVLWGLTVLPGGRILEHDVEEDRYIAKNQWRATPDQLRQVMEYTP